MVRYRPFVLRFILKKLWMFRGGFGSGVPAWGTVGGYQRYVAKERYVCIFSYILISLNIPL